MERPPLSIIRQYVINHIDGDNVCQTERLGSACAESPHFFFGLETETSTIFYFRSNVKFERQGMKRILSLFIFLAITCSWSRAQGQAAKTLVGADERVKADMLF